MSWTQPAAPWSQPGAALGTALLLGLLTAYYVFQGTLGTFGTLAWNTQYYDLAAEGFLRGHLYLPIQPLPQLLAAANPYDPQNRLLWMWDAVLYGGHYYIYWGPVPALILLGLKWLGYRAAVFDQWLVLWFMLGRMYAGAALILGVARRSGVRIPNLYVWLAIALFALASPTPFVMARSVIYEASIAAGQCFLFWGLYCAFKGVTEARLRTLYFAGAGLAWALALNSRATLGPVALLLVLFGALAVARDEQGRFRFATLMRALLALGIPVTLGVLACGWYNYVRFGSPGEFGITYQLTGRKFVGDSIYILPNLLSYGFAELAWSCAFPYVQLPWLRHLTDLIVWPADYDTGAYELGERVGGLFVMVPFCWLLALYGARIARGAWRQVRARGLAGFIPAGRLETWLVCSSLCATLALGPALFAFMASMRYLEDISGAVLLASIASGFWLVRRTCGGSRSRWPLRVFARALYVGLALVSIFIGVTLGFTGHTNNFPRQNPLLYARLVQSLSFCPAPQPVVLPNSPPR